MLAIATLHVALQVFGAFSPSHAAAVTLEHRSAGNSNIAAIPAKWDVYGYLFNVTVGSPPQNITMLSDMTWMAPFVRSGRCLSQFNPELCVAQGQSFFNEHDSTTFGNTTFAQATWPVTAFAPNFTVDYGRDKFCIGNICNKDTLMQVSDFPYPGSVVPVIPFGGIFGLAPTPKTITATSEPVNFQAWKNGNMGPLVGWHTCEVLKSAASCQGGDAQLVFGGTDTTMYSAKKIQSYEIQNPEWLSDAFYPSTPPRSNYWTVVDEGSEGLGAPLSLNGYKYLVRHIKSAKLASKAIVQNIQQQGSSGYNTANQDWYTVSCDGLDEFPNLVYQLDGRKKYTISPGDYVTKLTDMPGSVCYLNVNVWKYGRTENGDARVVLLGKAFLKRKYLVLNFEERSFGLAPLRTG
ncbi:fusarin C cluster-peptidase [Fusarium fujikuroi]|nr:fusarin C cluster-peptidase [Fusarium fujikuroi]